MTTRRERVVDHPLKSRSNTSSPLVVPEQILMTPTTTATTATTARSTNRKKSSSTTNTMTRVRERTAAMVEEREEESISSNSSLTTTFNTASLIQSAARSILDSVYTPTSTNVSDDENEEEDYENNIHVNSNINNDNAHAYAQQHRFNNRRKQSKLVQEQLPIPTLQSLQRETIPAMPDEQDRKRFVGCLAAVLASAYDFDVADDDDEDTQDRAESYAYLNRNEQGHDSDDDEFDDDNNNDNNGEFNIDNSFFSATEECLDSNNNDTFVVAAGGDDDDENDGQPYFSNACSTSFELMDAAGSIPDISMSHSDLDMMPSGNGTSSKRGQQQNQQYANYNRSKQQYTATIKQSILKKSAMARNRHRKRRYDLLSKLLLSSAELLLLDKSQARAFLPMLAKLLVPPTVSQKAHSDRIRKEKEQQDLKYRRQQQQQQQQQQVHYQQRPPRHNDGTSTSSVQTTPTKSFANSPADSPARTASPSVSSSTDKGINHYHFSPSTNMPVSRRVALPDDGYHIQHSDLIEYAKEEDDYFLPKDLDDEDHLRPFLESLGLGAGFRCLSLLLLQYLLNSAEGYDARIRHVIKKLGVIVLLHDMELERDLEIVEEGGDDNSTEKSEKQNRGRTKTNGRTKYEDLVGPATRKFEALEHAIAVRLIRLSKEQKRLQDQQSIDPNKAKRERQQRPMSGAAVPAVPAFSREQLVRGLKIGSAGLVAGTLFAVTGGIAAPGIAAGLAAFGSIPVMAAIVSSTPAITAIFGVGGGSLAAYKMNRRTQGLTEFEFRRQDKLLVDRKYDREEEEEEQAELFSTVCISGWLRDEYDFQRPWGIAPTSPRIRDRLELLQRFYSVYKPDHVSKCKKILENWKGEEKQLWDLLKQKYGRDPDHLYPILSSHENGFHRGLTLEQEEVLNELFVELGYVSSTICQSRGKHSPSTFDSVCERLKHPFANDTGKTSRQTQTGFSGKFRFTPERTTMPYANGSALLDESLHGPGVTDGESNASSGGTDSIASSHGRARATQHSGGEDKEQFVPPKHLLTVWDYHSKYGGELYTVKWESETLLELCDSVTDLAFDVINGATAQLLRQTALSTLLSAVAVPYALINMANMIDGTWTLAIERADEAGKELARSLLFSRAGHRPVTLVGFSFGARAIYSCLKELAKYQEKWETSRENSSNRNGYQGDDQYSCSLREPASIVEDVILMGLPNHLSLTSWKACRRIVGGRLVNCYSRKDLILSLMFQFKRLAGVLKHVCGTCVVEVSGVENVDVSDLVSGHQDYCVVAGEILKRVRHGQPFRTSVKCVGMNEDALLGN